MVIEYQIYDLRKNYIRYLMTGEPRNFEYTDVEPSNIEYGELVNLILQPVNSNLRASSTM